MNWPSEADQQLRYRQQRSGSPEMTVYPAQPSPIPASVHPDVTSLPRGLPLYGGSTSSSGINYGSYSSQHNLIGGDSTFKTYGQELPFANPSFASRSTTQPPITKLVAWTGNTVASQHMTNYQPASVKPMTPMAAATATTQEEGSNGGKKKGINCIERVLQSAFSSLGGVVASYPVVFIVIPIILTCVFSIGLKKFKNYDDIADLFTPKGARSKTEIKTQLKYFGHAKEYDYFRPSDRIATAGIAQALIVRRDGGNVLTEKAMQKMIEIDSMVRRLGGSGTYEQGCVIWKKKCFDSNQLISLYKTTANKKSLLSTLKYPSTTQNGTSYYIAPNVGGVSPEMTPESQNIPIAGATTLNLMYYRKVLAGNSSVWEGKFIELLRPLEEKFEEFWIRYGTTGSVAQELNKSANEAIPLFAITFFILVTFCFLSLLMCNLILSKPWLAIAATCNVILSIGSGFGLVMALGVKFTSQTALMPFLVLGIGLDDMFVMVAAWRTTPTSDDVKTRMSQMMKEAALSITITSLTDALAFLVGAFSRFKSIEIFSLYCGVSVIFCYFYSITFLAACIALDGRREAADKDSLFCCISRKRTESHHSIMTFFRDTYGTILLKAPSIVFILAIYATYIGLSVWGCSQLTESFQLRKLVPDDSYYLRFADVQERNFKVLGPKITLTVYENLKYYQQKDRAKVKRLVDELQSDKDIVKNQFTWIDLYEHYISSNTSNIQPVRNYSEMGVILVAMYFGMPLFQDHFLDLVRDNMGNIIASRYLIQARHISNSNAQMKMMKRLRSIVDGSEMKNVSIYSPQFVFYDQFASILPTTMMSIGIATAAMLVVSLLLLPHPMVAIFVTLTVISIEVGVFGIMSLWGVELDSISMINLVLCIGFSVDFAAHISYGFLSSEGNARDRTRQALYKLGYPMLQGGVSTILAISVLCLSKSYIFRVFFKTMFLVISLGMLHGLVFLPAILFIFGLIFYQSDM